MSPQATQYRQWPLWASLLLAIVLQITPAPQWFTALFPDVNIRPHWLLMVGIYWGLALPQRFSVGWIWAFGLILDISSGGLLGRQTLGLVICLWIAQRFYLQLRQFPVGQQAMVVGLFALLCQLILLWIDGATRSLTDPVKYFIPVATTALIWPICFSLLRRLRIGLHVR